MYQQPTTPAPTPRRFDDKQGRWWTVTWRDKDATHPAAGYLFKAVDADEELFLEGAPGAGPEKLARMSLGDVRQILSVARSGLI
jgi:hypothetical protein